MNEKNKNHTPLPTSDMEQNTSDESLGEKESEGFDSRVNITVTSYRKRNHDPDGVSVKAVLDGIVRRQILSDDSAKEINEIKFKSIIIKKGETERTVIDIEG